MYIHHILYAISIKLSEPYKDNKPEQMPKAVLKQTDLYNQTKQCWRKIIEIK